MITLVLEWFRESWWVWSMIDGQPVDFRPLPPGIVSPARIR